MFIKKSETQVQLWDFQRSKVHCVEIMTLDILQESIQKFLKYQQSQILRLELIKNG